MMSNKKVDISCSSEISPEKDLSRVLVIESWSRDKRNKALELDDLLNAERPVQIHCGNSTFCTVNLQTASNNEFSLFTVITQCPKLEVFYNMQQEYVNTHYGAIFDDFEDIKVYTFDIAIEKSNITDVTFKFLPEISEFWIFCIIVYLYPNTSPTSRINLENVQNILTHSSFKLSPNAEKCKDFMKNYLQPSTHSSQPHMQMMLSMLNSNFERQSTIGDSSSNNSTSNPKITNHQIVELKEYFDTKLLDLETRIVQRIEEAQKQQNEKLDDIFNLLRNKT